MQLILSLVLLYLLLGCEMDLSYKVDGQQHTVVLNPPQDSKP